ncbi:MAG TPA: zinc-binding dehydrogenase [Cellulomonas sp.]
MWAQTLIAPRTFDLRDVPAPSPDALRPGEVLVDLVAGATCASDLPFFRGTFRRPAEVFGLPGRPLHEVVARVAVSTVPELAEGDRVVGWASGFDGLQQQFVTRADGLAPVPAHLDDVQALAPQTAAVVLALADRVPTFEGKRVAVIGLGAYGNLLAAVARLRGAAEVVGIDRIDRSAEAARFGLDRFVHATSRQWARDLADDERPDIVIEAAGHQVASYADAVHAVAPRGGVYLFGAPDDDWVALPLPLVWLKEVTITGGPAHDTRRYLDLGAELAAEHPDLLDAVVTRTLPYQAAQQAYAAVENPQPGVLKVVLTA